MSLLDLFLPPRCAECGDRIKGEKVALPEGGYVCRPCHANREALANALRAKAEVERRIAERHAAMEARLLVDLETIKQSLAAAAAAALPGPQERFLAAMATELQYLPEIETDPRVANLQFKLEMMGKIDAEACALFQLTLLMEGHVAQRVATVPAVQEIRPGDMGREFVPLFTATGLMRILLREDATGERLTKLLRAINLIGRDLQLSGPYSQKADLYREIAASPAEVFAPLFAARGAEGGAAPSAEQTAALGRYLSYFARIPAHMYVFEILTALEQRVDLLSAESLLFNANKAGALPPVNLRYWIGEVNAAVGRINNQELCAAAEKQQRNANELGKEWMLRAAAPVCAAMREEVAQKLIDALRLFAREVS